ncbi:hypothetical protein LTR17_027618 [Elasticomyces elasticus]|nr:hypothetical protein LTR17_027618 [Elasticomyces elasticus]
MLTTTAVVTVLPAALSLAQSSTDVVISTLLPQIDTAPTLNPTVHDPVAPNVQQTCPGYTASNAIDTSSRFTADMTLAGPYCQAYGNDIDG